MNKPAFTVMKGKEEVVSLDDIKLARKALEEPGNQYWIRYNQNGVDLYNYYKDVQDTINDDETYLLEVNEKNRVLSLQLFQSDNDRTTGSLRDRLDNLYELAEELTRDIIFGRDEIKAGGIL